AVARDEAFCFYYQDNLDLLRAAGAELAFFSPLRDSRLPEGSEGVILGGGYPEVRAEALERNLPMREALRAFTASGRPIYAECGGLMYLTESIADLEGRSFEMVGLLPTRARMLPRRRALGYVEVTLRTDCLLGPRGAVARGHEFHYSEVEELPPSVERVYRVSKGKTSLAPGDAERLEGFRAENVLASYCHLHFLSNPQVAEALVEGCRGRGG
ncbi:MAG: cobyrinic acid a,c-diamide synthase, partial [Nitrospinota bacterium]